MSKWRRDSTSDNKVRLIRANLDELNTLRSVVPPADTEHPRSVRSNVGRSDLSFECLRKSIRKTLRLMNGRQNAKSRPAADVGERSLDTSGQECHSTSTAQRTKHSSQTNQLDAGLASGRRVVTRQNTKRKGQHSSKFRNLARFISMLFSLWKQHAKRVQNFFENNVDFLDVDVPSDLLFDVTEFKTAKQALFPWDIKRILMKPGKDRTLDEVRRVQVALSNYEPIHEYPVAMTLLMARRAWYERYPPKRVIIKQGHPPRCYYFILSGSVVMSKMEAGSARSKTECFLGRCEAFGDLAIVNKSPSESTAISRESVELLVFGDEDYTEIFMSGGLKDPEHPMFRNLYCLRGWPTRLLADNPDNALLSYFKRGTILVYNSKCNDWIFIVKSGSCSVLKKLRNTKPSPRKRVKVKVQQQEQSHGDILSQKLAEADEEREKTSFVYRQTRLQELNLGIELIPVGTKKWDPIEREIAMKACDQGTKLGKLSTSGPFLTKTNMAHHPSTLSSTAKPDTAGENKHSGQPMIPEIYIEDVPQNERFKRDIYLPEKQGGINRKVLADELNERYLNTGHVITDVDRDPLFIRVRILTEGATFGLSDFVHNDQPDLSLVSNGAECIVIRKKFYLDHVSKDLLAVLRKEVTPYPRDEELQNLMQHHVDWLFNRKKLVRMIKKENEMQRINVHDARSVPRLRD